MRRPSPSGVLEPDEQWTWQCNLMRDMLGLSDIDPHVLLVVFLPTLLFESACFVSRDAPRSTLSNTR